MATNSQLASNTGLAAPLPKSRRTMRLLLLLCGALVLVSLPVIPFNSLGIKCPPMPNMSQIAEDGNRMLNNLVPVVMGTISGSAPRQTATPNQDLKSLDQASDQLLDQINAFPPAQIDTKAFLAPVLLDEESAPLVADVVEFA